MAIKKIITIDGIEVPFKASAAVPRLYRLKFRRDIYKDFSALKTEVTEGDENKSEIGIESLEVFENIAYIMAKHADPENVPEMQTARSFYDRAGFAYYWINKRHVHRT